MTPEEYRAHITRILVKWRMPTRQAAIIELVQLRNQDVAEVIEEDEEIPDEYGPMAMNVVIKKENRNELRAEQRKNAELVQETGRSDTDNETFYTRPEVADILDVDEKRITEAARKLQVKKVGGRYIYTKEDVARIQKYFMQIDVLYQQPVKKEERAWKSKD